MSKLGIFINIVLGTALLNFGPIEGVLVLITGVSLVAMALLTIFVFGTFSMGWTLMLANPTDEVGRYAPGSPECERMWRVTMRILDTVKGVTYWIGAASSFYLMYGLLVQEWIFVLVMEILATALSYGFMGWADKRRLELTVRALGSEEA